MLSNENILIHKYNLIGIISEAYEPVIQGSSVCPGICVCLPICVAGNLVHSNISGSDQALGSSIALCTLGPSVSILKLFPTPLG